MAKRFHIDKKIKEFEKMRRNLPKQVGNIAKNHFLKAFEDEAFSDGSNRSDPWKARKTLTKRDRRTNKRRALLVQSGALKRSIRVREATWKRVRVGSYGIPYASYHNNGTKRLPQRQFIGESKIMTRRIEKLIQYEIRKISEI